MLPTYCHMPVSYVREICFSDKLEGDPVISSVVSSPTHLISAMSVLLPDQFYHQVRSLYRPYSTVHTVQKIRFMYSQK
jgi:hypothetical protein